MGSPASLGPVCFLCSVVDPVGAHLVVLKPRTVEGLASLCPRKQAKPGPVCDLMLTVHLSSHGTCHMLPVCSEPTWSFGLWGTWSITSVLCPRLSQLVAGSFSEAIFLPSAGEMA